MTEDEKKYYDEKIRKSEETDKLLFEKVNAVLELTNTINDRLHKDNGDRSLVTRIRDNERCLANVKQQLKEDIELLKKQLKKNPWLIATKWLVVTSAGLILSGFIGTVFWVLKSVLTG